MPFLLFWKQNVHINFQNQWLIFCLFCLIEGEPMPKWFSRPSVVQFSSPWPFHGPQTHSSTQGCCLTQPHCTPRPSTLTPNLHPSLSCLTFAECLAFCWTPNPPWAHHGDLHSRSGSGNDVSKHLALRPAAITPRDPHRGRPGPRRPVPGAWKRSRNGGVRSGERGPRHPEVGGHAVCHRQDQHG